MKIQLNLVGFMRMDPCILKNNFLNSRTTMMSYVDVRGVVMVDANAVRMTRFAQSFAVVEDRVTIVLYMGV